MKIKVYKENEEITTKIVEEDGSNSDFDYIRLINALYDNNIPNLEICDDIDDTDRTKIKKMYDKICQTVSKKIART